MFVKILLANDQIPLQQVEQLLLHQVDLGQAESKVLIALDHRVSCPVLVLW